MCQQYQLDRKRFGSNPYDQDSDEGNSPEPVNEYINNEDDEIDKRFEQKMAQMLSMDYRQDTELTEKATDLNSIVKEANMRKQVPFHQEIVYDRERMIIHNYKLMNYINEGSFGEVFLCCKINDKSNKLYAMKVQDKKSIDNENQLKYISRERQILSKIAGHPFIVNIEEAF